MSRGEGAHLPCRLRASRALRMMASLRQASRGDVTPEYTGGCLCGAVRYRASGTPLNAGHCYCADCRKASGSGFIPFMGFKREAVVFTGLTVASRSTSASGRDAVRNRCAHCGSLVFGGELGRADSFTVYAGSLDEPQKFEPRIAIFAHGRPTWAMIPAGLTLIDGVPP